MGSSPPDILNSFGCVLGAFPAKATVALLAGPQGSAVPSGHLSCSSPKFPVPLPWEAGEEPGSHGDGHRVPMPLASPCSWLRRGPAIKRGL